MTRPFGPERKVTCGDTSPSGDGTCTREPFHYGMHEDKDTSVIWGTSQQRAQEESLRPTRRTT